MCIKSNIAKERYNKGLVTNYREGGSYKMRGGASEVLPLQKKRVGGGGAEQVLAMLKGGGVEGGWRGGTKRLLG